MAEKNWMAVDKLPWKHSKMSTPTTEETKFNLITSSELAMQVNDLLHRLMGHTAYKNKWIVEHNYIYWNLINKLV